MKTDPAPKHGDSALHSALARIARGVGGQAFVRLAVFLNGIITVPVMLHGWGAEMYGEWLALTALASYLALSNLGLSGASCMAIISAASSGDFNKAARIFQSSFNALTALLCLFGGCLYAAVLFSPSLRATLNISAISASDTSGIIGLVLLQVIFVTLKSLYVGVSNALGRYGFPNAVSGSLKLLELTAISLCVAVIGVAPIAVAMISTCMGLVDLLAQMIIARRGCDWARFSFKTLDLQILRDLCAPSAGHAMIYVAVNAIVVQGPRVVLSAVVGPSAVAVFSVYSTLVRTLDHVSNLLLPVFQLEFARVSSKGPETSEANKLVSVSGRVAMLVFMLTAGALFVFSLFAFNLWTSHRLQFDPRLLGLFIATAFFTQLGRTSLTYLLGLNAILPGAIRAFGIACAGLLAGALLTHYFGVGGMITGQLMSECLTAFVLAHFAAQKLGISGKNLLLSQVDFAAAMRQVMNLLAFVGASRRIPSA